MAEAILKFVERFPENQDAIHELRQTNPAFDVLCEEYNVVGSKLEKLMQTKDSDASTRMNSLRARRVAIEEELITVIEGYRPC